MVFHALDVVIDDVLIETKKFQKVGKQLVAAGDASRQCFTGCREHHASILFVFEQSLRVESLNHIRHARLGDVQALRDIDDSRISLGIDQLENPFEIILHGG